MKKGQPEWVNFSLSVKDVKYSLGSIARYPAKLSDAFDTMDMDQSLDWSLKSYGMPSIIDKIIKTQAYEVTPEDVLTIAGGTSMAIFLTCFALLKPGDEVICEEPGWQQVERYCARMGVRVKKWRLYRRNRWQPDLDELKQLINDKTKLIYINHPHNPTGAVLSADKITELCNIAAKHGTYILSDEIYRGLEWDGHPFSPAIVNFYERGISASSLTKIFGVTGIRFGWFATRDKTLYQNVFDLAYDSVLCNNIMSERIAEQLLEPSRYSALLQEGRENGQQNLNLVHALVRQDDLWELIPAQGSYSCLIKYNTGEPSWDFCERMLKRKPVGLRSIPGVCFGDDCEYHLRLGFGNHHELFSAALSVLDAAAREYHG